MLLMTKRILLEVWHWYEVTKAGLLRGRGLGRCSMRTSNAKVARGAKTCPRTMKQLY